MSAVEQCDERFRAFIAGKSTRVARVWRSAIAQFFEELDEAGET